MSSRDYRLYLEDMQQACEDILQFTRDTHSAQELENDRRTLLAVIRSLEVLGEASRQISRGFKEKHPEIPWREIGDLRNIIAHEYFGLDLDIIWDVIRNQIPGVAERVNEILKGNV
jgi:uncharacterized protein with HEPN domain